MRKGLHRQLTARSASCDTSISSTGAELAADNVPSKPLVEVDIATFHAALQGAGRALVLVDCFTDWCGPCKLIMPTLEQWHAEMEGKVVMTKFNCNKANKALGMSLGIKVAPTFILFKETREVARMAGAKADELRAMIEAHM